jgi:hypothetical protein
MNLDKNIMMKNALIAEMIIGMTSLQVSDPPKQGDNFIYNNGEICRTVYLSDLDYEKNWNSLMDAYAAYKKLKDVPDRFSNNISHNLEEHNKDGLFLSLSSLAEWLKWRKNISLSRKIEVEK